nr:hypothetical protein GCM10020092_038860 [Actinoplanes digitatis]
MENSPSTGSTRAHSTENRYAFSPIPATRSTSSRHRCKASQASPDGSRKAVGVTCSANQVSLVSLPPSVWCPEVATPQRKPSGKIHQLSPYIDARAPVIQPTS